MNTFIQITTEDGQLYYTLLYKLSFLLAFIIYIFIGLRKKYPLHTWLILGAVGSIFFIIGTKVGTYTLDEWQVLFTHGKLVNVPGKSLVGGLILGVVSIALFKAWLHFKPSVLDSYAIILPFALIVQRIGCLLAGCCFGIETSMPWGVQYASHYSIAEQQIQEGVISTLAGSSMAVHPVPLYLIGVYLLVLMAIWKTKNRWKFNGSLFLFALSVLLGLRFFVEFIRDPATNHALGALVYGLKEIQWLLIILVLLFTGVLILRERFGILTSNISSKPPKGLSGHAFMAMVLLFIVWLGRTWFTGPETLIIHSYILLALIALCIQIGRFRKQLTFKFSTLTLFLISFLLMGQTYDDGKPIPPDQIGAKSKTLTITARKADFDLAFREKEYSGEGCDRQVMNSDSLRISSGISTGIQFVEKTQKTSEKVGIIGGGLTYSQFNKHSFNSDVSKVSSVGGNLFFGSSWKYMEYRLGLSLGAFNTISDLKERQDFESRVHPMVIYPIAAFRVGEENKFFFETSVGADLPYDILYSRYKLGLGIGASLFKLNNNSKIRFGYAENIDHNTFYIDMDVALGDQVIIQPGARLGNIRFMGLV